MVKELRWNSLAPQSLQLLVCGIAECQLDDLASALLPACQQHTECISMNVPVICVFVFSSRCLRVLCCVAVQAVNGHFRKVTVWVRKDSIVYRHSARSWRWTTMVSLISVSSFISTQTKDSCCSVSCEIPISIGL